MLVLPMTPEARAAELLPCICQTVRDNFHYNGNTYCPAHYRPAVAAALKQQRDEGYDIALRTGAQCLREKEAEAAALREQLENWKQVAFEADQAKGCLEEKVSELESQLVAQVKFWGEQVDAARVEGLREAAKLCDKNVWASQAKFDIDAEIAALEVATAPASGDNRGPRERGKEEK